MAKARKKPQGASLERHEVGQIVAVERTLRIVEMRKLGHSFVEIAREMGDMTAKECYQAYSRALADLRRVTRESLAELRDLELMRLEAVAKSLLPLCGVDGGAPIFDAVDRLVKIMDRKAKMLGLDAPQVKKIEGGLTMGHYPMDKPPETDDDARRLLQDALGANC